MNVTLRGSVWMANAPQTSMITIARVQLVYDGKEWSVKLPRGAAMRGPSLNEIIENMPTVMRQATGFDAGWYYDPVLDG